MSVSHPQLYVRSQVRAAGTHSGADVGQVRTEVRNHHGANPGAIMVFQHMAEQRLLLLFKLTEASTWLNST